MYQASHRMVLFMSFEALYFGHFLLFHTMQLEPPKLEAVLDPAFIPDPIARVVIAVGFLDSRARLQFLICVWLWAVHVVGKRMMRTPALCVRGVLAGCLPGWGERLRWVGGGGRLLPWGLLWLVRGVGRCAPSSPRSFPRGWRWWDRERLGLEEAVGNLLVGVPQPGFCQRLRGRLCAFSCVVGDCPHCLWMVRGPW